jgi:hypothetical protein
LLLVQYPAPCLDNVVSACLSDIRHLILGQAKKGSASASLVNPALLF